MSEKAYVVYPMDWEYKRPNVQTIIMEFDLEEQAIDYMKNTSSSFQFVLVKYDINDVGVHEGKGKLIALKSTTLVKIIV